MAGKAPIGQRIKGIRKLHAQSQLEFVSRLGITAGYLSEIEQGKKIPSDEVLGRIAGVFHLNESWLRTGDAPIFSKELLRRLGKEADLPQAVAKMATAADVKELGDAFYEVQALLKQPKAKEDWYSVVPGAADRAVICMRERVGMLTPPERWLKSSWETPFFQKVIDAFKAYDAADEPAKKKAMALLEELRTFLKEEAYRKLAGGTR